jgi:hypothetical protein
MSQPNNLSDWLSKNGSLSSKAPENIRQEWGRLEFLKLDVELLSAFRKRELPVLLRFKCGHETNASLTQIQVRNKAGRVLCPICGKTADKNKGLGANGKPTQNTSPEIRNTWGREQFQALGIEMLGSYERAEKKVLVKFKCGHVDSITLTTAKSALQLSSTACKLCSGAITPVQYEKADVIDRESLRKVRLDKNAIHISIQDETDPYFRLLPFYFGDWATCTYCGSTAQCVEHIIPVCFFLAVPREAMNQGTVNSMGIRTSACHSCNNFAGGKVFNTFEEKCVFINWRIQMRLRRLKTADWTDMEIGGLKGKLKDFVRLKKIEKVNLENREKWYGSNSFFETIKGMEAQPVFHKDSGVFAQSVYDYFASILSRLVNYQNESPGKASL